MDDRRKYCRKHTKGEKENVERIREYVKQRRRERLQEEAKLKTKGI
jgi:hypothetical protein